jgi:hypothetical protein
MRLEWLSLGLSWCLTCGPVEPAPEVAPDVAPEVGAAAVLHAWDDRRASAWAAGEPAALRRLYVAGSPAGSADVAMLRSWRRRGLRVEGLRMQLLDLEVRRASPARLDLVVTDRLSGAVGVGVGPGVRVALPRDHATTRRVVLVLVGTRWRVAQASAARTTSWTVRSRNE